MDSFISVVTILVSNESLSKQFWKVIQTGRRRISGEQAKPKKVGKKIGKSYSKKVVEIRRSK